VNKEKGRNRITNKTEFSVLAFFGNNFNIGYFTMFFKDCSQTISIDVLGDIFDNDSGHIYSL